MVVFCVNCFASFSYILVLMLLLSQYINLIQFNIIDFYYNFFCYFLLFSHFHNMDAFFSSNCSYKVRMSHRATINYEQTVCVSFFSNNIYINVCVLNLLNQNKCLMAKSIEVTLFSARKWILSF